MEQAIFGASCPSPNHQPQEKRQNQEKGDRASVDRLQKLLSSHADRKLTPDVDSLFKIFECRKGITLDGREDFIINPCDTQIRAS